MNILSFNTSTEKFSLAIYKKNKIIFYYSRILEKNYSKYLIPIIQDSLNKAKINLKQINIISISLGPGSFTGIRLGIAAAKGLSAPHNISLFGFNNMDLILNSLDKKNNNKKILILIKSKKNDFYYQIFDSKHKPLNKIAYFSNFKLPKFSKNEEILVTGDINKETKNKIKFIVKKKFLFKKNSFNAKNLINLTKLNLSKNYVKKIEPIYIYDHYAKHIQK